MPYVNLLNTTHISARPRVATQEYRYARGCPVAGNSAVMPDAIAKLQEEGRRVLVAERGGRYLAHPA